MKERKRERERERIKPRFHNPLQDHIPSELGPNL
jgi:hypothetical protein